MSQPRTSTSNSSPKRSEDNFAAKPSVSEHKIAANRRNALRSTGPKTARGKSIVARNAVKHGILAREVVITAGDGKENAEDFRGLVGELFVRYKPVGAVEEALVQTIACCLWRKSRVLRAENGEIRKRLDTLLEDRQWRNSDKANLNLVLTKSDLGLFSRENQADAKLSTMERWSIMQDVQVNLREHTSSLAYLSALLPDAKSQVDTQGYMSEEMQTAILRSFCLWDPLLAFICLSGEPAGGPRQPGAQGKRRRSRW